MSYPRWEPAGGPVKCKGCKAPCPPGTDIYVKSKGVYYCAGCGTLAENAPSDVKPGGIEEGFVKDLAKYPPESLETSLARQALYMARQLDDGDVSPREVTQYTKEIRINLLAIMDMFPDEDDTDDTETRREKLNERRRREQGGI
jgi:hypothetical protein